MAWTKQKQRDYNREYAKKNKERLAAYQKEWRKKNKAWLAEYQEINKERDRKRNKKYRESNKDRQKELWDAWYLKNKKALKPKKKKGRYTPKSRFNKAKNGAEERGIKWTLKFEDYERIIQDPCFYCANQLGEPTKLAGGLDRLNSNKGYSLSNVVSCCVVCNVMKGNFLTPEETAVAVQAILSLRKKKGIKKKPASTKKQYSSNRTKKKKRS